MNFPRLQYGFHHPMNSHRSWSLKLWYFFGKNQAAAIHFGFCCKEHGKTNSLQKLTERFIKDSAPPRVLKIFCFSIYSLELTVLFGHVELELIMWQPSCFDDVFLGNERVYCLAYNGLVFRVQWTFHAYKFSNITL